MGGRKRSASRARRSGSVVGRISLTRRGYGFVEAAEGDIYVARRDLGGAMHRDIVAVRPDAKSGRRGRSGRVTQVLERANDTLVGRFERHGATGIVVPTDPRLRTDVFVSAKDADGVHQGDIVVARITAFPTPSQAAQGYIEEVVGNEGDPDIAIEIVIREHALRTCFPQAVIEDAEQVGSAVPAGEVSRRRDIRERFTFTIDPVDARDFDDAITIEHLDGMVRLGVHIADVSHYVPWGSPIDAEARLRGTSVYLVDRVLPMIPEHLSNGVCSLNPGQDRLAFTVDALLARDGVVESYELYLSVIRSDHRFDYDHVQKWLDGAETFPDAPSERALKDFARIAKAVEKRRLARGGLEFETVEAKVVLDQEGHPLDVRLRARTQATGMIEEAMILANEIVASHMASVQAPMIFRIHEEPDPDALDRAAVILKEFDYPIQEIRGASPQTFQRIIDYAHTRPEKLLINSLLLRAMERARYVDYLDSHFGLASEAYTHFTSPIRRYPDLVVHRLLKAQLVDSLDTDPLVAQMVPELDWLAEHCSFTEREAEMAEDDSVRIKLCELMAEYLGEVFSGIITGVQSFGLFVQLENTAEGLVHVESMADDWYRLDAERYVLVGEGSGRSYRLGMPVRVRITNVIVAESRIDLEIA